VARVPVSDALVEHRGKEFENSDMTQYAALVFWRVELREANDHRPCQRFLAGDEFEANAARRDRRCMTADAFGRFELVIKQLRANFSCYGRRED